MSGKYRLIQKLSNNSPFYLVQYLPEPGISLVSAMIQPRVASLIHSGNMDNAVITAEHRIKRIRPITISDHDCFYRAAIILVMERFRCKAGSVDNPFIFINNITPKAIEPRKEFTICVANVGATRQSIYFFSIYTDDILYLADWRGRQYRTNGHLTLSETVTWLYNTLTNIMQSEQGNPEYTVATPYLRAYCNALNSESAIFTHPIFGLQGISQASPTKRAQATVVAQHIVDSGYIGPKVSYTLAKIFRDKASLILLTLGIKLGEELGAKIDVSPITTAKYSHTARVDFAISDTNRNIQECAILLGTEHSLIPSMSVFIKQNNLLGPMLASRLITDNAAECILTAIYANIHKV